MPKVLTDAQVDDVRARRLPLAGPRDERRARAALPPEVRGARGARARHQEDEDEVAPALPVGAGDRRRPAHPRHLRGPDRPQLPLLEHGVAREEGRRRDLRRLAPGLAPTARRDPVVLGRARAVGLRHQQGCLRGVPGSHKWGILKHEESDDPKSILARGQYITDPFDESKAVDFALSAGRDGDVRQLARARLRHATSAPTAASCSWSRCCRRGRRRPRCASPRCSCAASTPTATSTTSRGPTASGRRDGARELDEVVDPSAPS